MKQFFSFIATLALLVSPPLSAELPPLIPRDLLFGNTERAWPIIAPDGTRLAFRAPDTNNVLQVWVKTVGKHDEKIVTADKRQVVYNYFFAKDNQTLLYTQGGDGDENDHLFGVDLVSGNVRDYTPFHGVRVSDTQLNLDFPDTALVSMNLRDRALFDVYRINLRTGALILDTRNPGDVASWLPDPRFRIRVATAGTPEDGTEIRVRASEKSAWKTLLKAGPEEKLDVWEFTADGKSLYLRSSIGRDTAALIVKNTATGAEKVLAASEEADMDSVVFHPRRRVVQAVGFGTSRHTWKVLDPAVKRDFAALAKLEEGDFSIDGQTAADDVWLLTYDSACAPFHFYQWDRKAQRGTLLFSAQPKLDTVVLDEMKVVVITTRDALKIEALLTLPAGVPPKHLPMVLLAHGGPWVRETWRFNPTVQWLANRGYAVLVPNYRGSVGYGKKFVNAGKQSVLKIQDDLIDSVNWAVKEGIADPRKVAIMGQSFGGYCALAAAAFTPEVFACAVDINGPPDLKGVLKSRKAQSNVPIGSPDDPEDAQLIYNSAPANFAHRITCPLLIGQGANDRRVRVDGTEQIVTAIQKAGGRLTYVLYPDEGHWFARPENRTDFNARTEAFLGTYLGGRVEPMAGERIPGSTAVIRVIGGAK